MNDRFMKKIAIAFSILQISSASALELPIILPLEKFQSGSSIDNALSLHIFQDENGVEGDLVVYSYWKTVPMKKVEPVIENIPLKVTSSAAIESLDGMDIHIEFANTPRTATLNAQLKDKDYLLNYIYNDAYHVWKLVNP